MKSILLCKETDPKETRTALVPADIKRLVSMGYEIKTVRGTGLKSGISDAEYEAAGAVLVSSNEEGYKGLNGDLLIWYPILNRSIELSSMGIRVDKEALLRQLKLTGKEDRKELFFHKCLLEGKLPLTIGGGIGQSRLCLVLLHKAHIGETQCSIWPEDMRRKCHELGMNLI